MFPRPWPILFLLATCLNAGCGGAAKYSPPTPDGAPSSDLRGEVGVARAHRQANGPDTKPANGNAAKPASEPPQRKILYTAQVDVVVKDFDPAVAEVNRLVQKYKAYLASSEVRVNSGSVRTGTFTLRVPVENFQGFKGELLALGVPERDTIKSDDVTAEFFDLQGRLKNLRSSQDRLIELKKNATVKEVLEIEPQLERVNEKIEQIEGRLKYIEAFAALSTINLSLREIKDYKPPTAPTFGNRIRYTFDNSWDAFLNFCEGIVLFGVALGPWLPVLIPLGLLGFWLVRKLVRAAAAPVSYPGRTPPPGPLVERPRASDAPPANG